MCTLTAANACIEARPEAEVVLRRGADGTPLRRREVMERWESLPDQTDAEALEVPGDADPGSVKAAYLRLVRRFHPDAAGADMADLRDKLQEILIRITEAYQTLGGHRSPFANPMLRTPLPTPSSPAPTPRTPTPPRAVAPPPVSVRVRVEEALGRAQALLDERQPAAAAELLEQHAHRADREQSEGLHLLLGRSYLAMRKWRRSATHLREAIGLDPGNAEAHLLLGQAYEGAGFVTRAETAYRKALLLRPGHVQALMRLSGIRPLTPSGRSRPGIVGRLFGNTRFGG